MEEGEHCYQASNVYESGESELTAQECIDYQNTPPLEFNLLDPVDNSEVTTLTPLLSWEAAIDTDPFDILKYTLYFDTPEPGIMDIFVDTAISYEVPTLLDNTAYYWKVVATDLFGETIENIGGYHSFIINTANDSPANFELVTPTDGSVEITLTPFFYWEPATDLDPNDMVSYNLYIDLDNLFTDTAPISLDTNAFDYSTLNIFLNDNSSYLWTVNASDNHAAITNTDTLQFWTDQYPEPPEPFGRISPSNDTELDLGNVIFTWGSTIDVDPLDFVQYTLMYTYNGGDTTIIPELLDTTYAVELDIDRQYYWHVIASDKDALLTFADGSEGMWSFVLGSLNINELLSLTEYALYNAYPNPFNPVTAIKYAVPEASHLSISIYDMIGREIAELYNGSQVPGFHTVIWDASEVSSGIYFAKMIAGEYISTQKLMLIK